MIYVSIEFLSLSRRRFSSRNVPQRWWARRKVCCSQATRKHEFEKVFGLKTGQFYFIYPFPRRLKIFTNVMCQLFRLSWHFKREKSVFWKAAFFAKQELIMRARLRLQDFATCKNFSFNQCHNKEFCCFFSVRWPPFHRFGTPTYGHRCVMRKPSTLCCKLLYIVKILIPI